ncbi:MAG TPA: DNA translocase FtsK 4TM domain-containing protein [Ktedonobacteraceae bacterium]|nr:DNA translocase FtsK 4TM domain-containing protein [Ktedonobacteraceae bacterium]
MAGNDSKKAPRLAGRVGPSIDANKNSRVSKAAGSIGSESMRVEQRGNVMKQRASAPNRKGQGQSRGQKQGPKGAAPANRPVPKASTPAPADVRFIGRMVRGWNNLKPHHQQRIYGLVLIGLSVLLIFSLTIWHKIALFSPLSNFFVDFFGWSAYPLAFGLFIFACAHFLEGLRNARFIRMSLVFGLFVLLLLLLAESQLIGHGRTGGIVGQLLVAPLNGWPALAGHVLVIGLFIIAAILTFRITLGHVRIVTGFFGKTFSGARRPSSYGNRPSPFLGQRPQYSRYASSLAPAPAGAPARSGMRPNAGEDDLEEDSGPIEFNADFDDDDPDNDINVHKQQVGLVPRGARSPQPLDREEHKAAVQGARQQPLPFKEMTGNGRHAANNNALDDEDEMEPLAPNPLRARPPKVAAQAAKPGLESPWKLPDTNILNNPEEVKLQLFGDDTSSLAKVIQDTLRSFRVEAEVRPEDISIGPTVIRFGIRPTGKPAMKVDEKGRQVPIKDAAGNIVYESRTRVSRIMALQNDLALVLEAKNIRMEAPVPGRPYVGVEIPNKNSRLVTLREILESKEYQAAKAKSRLAVALGKDVAGAVRVGDLARMPHLLIAGATGAGKSVSINAIICSILTQATPDDVRMLMVDPKMVELNMYNGIPHLLSPVVTEVDKVVGLLKIAISEMEKRYRLFSQLGVRNLDGYRKLRAERVARGDNVLKNLPAIVIIIDELADLMMAAPEEVEGLICRLAQLARATGIHLVVATQRPSVDVITGLIKANIPTRISFMVSSAVDSRTIIDMGGAERLLGRGDMLYLPADAGKPERIQGAFVADDEAERLVNYWRQQATEHAAAAAAANGGNGAAASPLPVEPGWEVSERISDEYELDDELLDQAEQVVHEYERASISLLQRRLRIGYSRAARLIDLLEERGVIGRSEPGGRPREVYDNRPFKNGGNGNRGEGRTMADEAADIIAEEKAREEFLKKQAMNANRPSQGQGNGS